MTPSQTAIQLAMTKQLPVITEDIEQAEMNLQAAASIVAQGLRAVVVIPLYATSRASSESATNVTRGEFLGVLYLDSKRPTAFSKLDRQILDALAADAASILDNARLVERERERQRLEQEIGIARDIQQALLPKNFRDYPHLSVSGINLPCLSVGGDYFDVFPLDEKRTAFLLADVSGKGLGAALLTTMLQGALSDFNVEYTLIVRLVNPHLRVQTLSELHGNVLDMLNEYGVQIMSPHFMMQPETSLVVPRSKWHEPPAAPDNGSAANQRGKTPADNTVRRKPE